MGRTARIDGLRLSHELLFIRILPVPGAGNPCSLLYRHLADNRVNVPFLSVSGLGKDMGTCCCVSATDQGRVRALIGAAPVLRECVTFVSSVGMISLFPHQNSMTILGCSLQAFGEAGLPLYGMGSSLSSVTFVTDYARIREAATLLDKRLGGPFEWRSVE